jgi:hypothetical protein
MKASIDLRPGSGQDSGVNRRRFLLTSLAGALVTPLAVEAQQAGTVYRVGVVGINLSPRS